MSLRIFADHCISNFTSAKSSGNYPSTHGPFGKLFGRSSRDGSL